MAAITRNGGFPVVLKTTRGGYDGKGVWVVDGEAEVGELREGNPVKFRGVQVGRVTGIAIGAQGEGVLVEMEVDPGIGLKQYPCYNGVQRAMYGLSGKGTWS